MQTICAFQFIRPWVFEATPSSSESLPENYLRKVQESDLVVWLVGSETTEPVAEEINTCMSAGIRLLAFMLPSESRDERTKSLVARVQAAGYAKWSKVKNVNDLAEHIEKALSDEVTRAFRNPTIVLRASKLKEMKQLSLSRCRRMWTSLGVPDCIAIELADNQSVGDILDLPYSGVLRVEGEQGSGKTLAAERLFQKAADHAILDSSQPFPLFVSARDLRDPIVVYIDQMSKDFCRPSVQGIMVIIDGLDEVGVDEANSLLSQIVVYANANSRATMVVTSRPLPGLQDDVGEVFSMPAMGNNQRMKLISKIACQPMEWLESYPWPTSVREAIEKPLFAAMLGSVLRESPDSIVPKRRNLVTTLAERSLQEVGNAVVVDELLQKLAVKATSTGKRVALNDVSPKYAEQRMLTNSRLINDHEGSVDFTLPIFREWYAGRALVEQSVSVDDIQPISDRWIIPLTIAVDSGDDGFRRSLMAGLASSDPGLASLVLQDFKPSWRADDSEAPQVGTSIEVGVEIRSAMKAWQQGLRKLYPVIGPVDSFGNTATLGVGGNSPYFLTSWYQGAEKLPPVIEMSGSIMKEADPDWPKWLLSELPRTKLWSWSMTLSQLAKSLSDKLDLGSLVLETAPIDAVREFGWAFALAAQGQGEFNSKPVEIRNILRFIETRVRSRPVTLGTGHILSKVHVETIRLHLLSLIEDGEDFINDPWPPPDQLKPSGRVWENYSRERLFERTKAVYTGALRIYKAIVEKWFGSFAMRLRLNHLLPIKLVGRLKLPHQWSGTKLGLVLTMYPQLLPEGEESRVAFELGTSEGMWDDFQEYWEDGERIRRRLRAEIWRTPSPVFTSTRLEVIGSLCATELALGWLKSELRDLGWKR